MSEIDINIRPFRKDDQIAARAIILQGLGEHFGFIDETLNLDLNDITASYSDQGHIFLVAEHRQSLIGTGALLIYPDKSGQLVRISTDPAYRRAGIARALCQQLISYAQQQMLRRLIVETNDDWDNAIRLYQNLGFDEYTHQEGSVYLGLDLSISKD